MKLEEKHKEFVVKCFARFMTLTNIVDAFMEEFEDDLPPPPKLLTLKEWMAQPLSDEENQERLEFLNEFIADYQEEYREKHGGEADKKLNEDAIENFDLEREMEYTTLSQRYREQVVPTHEKELRENLFSRFRRLDINHGQFPDKYKVLFKDTRDEFCKNYRIPDLSVPENVVRELETLYGYEKQRIFQHSNSKDVTKHVTLAHQILKTIIACNAINMGQETIDVTPQDVNALKETQKALTD